MDNEQVENKSLDAQNKQFAIENLTDQQWLFIKHFLETSDLMVSYKEAGYTGKLTSAPYQLFKKLKPLIEELVNNELISKLKYNNDLKKALSIPLQDKESLTVSEWLRLRKHAKALIPEMEQQRQQLSVLVVNRYGDKKGDTVTGQKDITPPLNTSNKEVIDVTPIE